MLNSIARAVQRADDCHTGFAWTCEESGPVHEFLWTPEHTLKDQGCQSASKFDPLSACNIDPLSGTAEVVPVVNRGDPCGFV